MFLSGCFSLVALSIVSNFCWLDACFAASFALKWGHFLAVVACAMSES